jgi:hypothetical protein
VTDHDQGAERAVTKLFGAMLMAAGGLIAGLCGLCSAVVLVTLLARDAGAVGPMFLLTLIFGGVPIALGVGLLIWGRSLWRTGS